MTASEIEKYDEQKVKVNYRYKDSKSLYSSQGYMYCCCDYRNVWLYNDSNETQQDVAPYLTNFVRDVIDYDDIVSIEVIQ